MSLYQKYLVADQIVKRMESVGACPGAVYFVNGMVRVDLEFTFDPGGRYSPPEDRERIVEAFLAEYPDSTLTREKDYSGIPEMVVRGESSSGFAWQIDFRDGVCEKVQVGTKMVERYDEDVLAAVPKRLVEEPVYEYLCADPIVAAGLLESVAG